MILSPDSYTNDKRNNNNNNSNNIPLENNQNFFHLQNQYFLQQQQQQQQQQLLQQQQQHYQFPQQNIKMNGNGNSLSSSAKLLNKLKRRIDEENEDIRNNKKYLSQTMADRIGVLSLDDNDHSTNHLFQQQQQQQQPQQPQQITQSSFTPNIHNIKNPFQFNNLNSNNNNNSSNNFNVDSNMILGDNNIIDDNINSITNINTRNTQLAIIPQEQVKTIPYSDNSNNNSNNNNSNNNNNNISNVYKSKPKNDPLERLIKSETNLKSTMVDMMPPQDIKSLLFPNNKPINIPQSIHTPENKNMSLILYTEPKEIINDSIKKQIEKRKEQIRQNLQKSKLETVDEEDEMLEEDVSSVSLKSNVINNKNNINNSNDSIPMEMDHN